MHRLCGWSVATCTRINTTSHAAVPKFISVMDVLPAFTLCLELSSRGIYIKDGKTVHSWTVLQTYCKSLLFQNGLQTVKYFGKLVIQPILFLFRDRFWCTSMYKKTLLLFFFLYALLTVWMKNFRNIFNLTP